MGANTNGNISAKPSMNSNSNKEECKHEYRGPIGDKCIHCGKFCDDRFAPDLDVSKGWEERLEQLRSMNIAGMGKLYTDLDIKQFIQQTLDERTREILEMIPDNFTDIFNSSSGITERIKIKNELKQAIRTKYNL